MTGTALDPEAVRDWLHNSCANQGVPDVIRDPAIIAQVATLLGHAPSSAGIRGTNQPRKQRRPDLITIGQRNPGAVLDRD